MSLIPYKSDDIFHEMGRMIDEMRSLMERSFMGLPRMSWIETPGVTPLQVNVSEDEKSFRVEAMVPGLSEDDITVEVQGDVLSISGEYRSKREEEDKDRTWHMIEQRYGRFERCIRLPAEIDRDRVEAEMENGVLTITLPKTQPSPLHRIAVKAKKALASGKNNK